MNTGMIKTWYKHFGQLLDTVNGFDVINCNLCGFKHIIPIPTTEELEQVYREDYYTTEKPMYLERYQEDMAWWNLVYSERFDSFEQLLHDGQRRILDVGSGPGHFLLQGKKRGWQTVGVEPSKQSAQHSRKLGLEIIEDFFDDRLAKQLGIFDVVNLSQVLEHIPDPRQMIMRVRTLLAPNGLVCVIVPNDYNPFQTILRTTCGYSPWWVSPPHHINYFDFNSLSNLLKDCKFNVILTETTFPMELFLLMGENYVDNDGLGRRCHARRKTMELNFAHAGATAVKKDFYKAMAHVGLGREVVFVARVTADQDN